MDGGVGGWMDGRMDGWVGGWMDGWMDMKSVGGTYHAAGGIINNYPELKMLNVTTLRMLQT